jgi:glutaredoxin
MKHPRRWDLFAAAALLACSPAWAQYKVVGPDGKITYTDRPPTAEQGKLAPAQASGSGDAALPYALRSVVARFPVVLYTIANCDPCDRGRDLLRTRGVPFRERTATTQADLEAWTRLIGSQQAPVLSVGGQMLRGLQVESWNSYLDAAGYPRDSRLPSTYVAPPPQPLAEPKAPPPAAEPAPAPAAPPAPPPPASGGFRF